MEQFRWPTPEGHTFDRDEANENSAVWRSADGRKVNSYARGKMGK